VSDAGDSGAGCQEGASNRDWAIPGNIPWTPAGTLARAEPVSTAGSYAVLRAEMDLVIAFSACPQDVLPINGRTGHTTEAHFVVE
jgi:uncharacterized protein